MRTPARVVDAPRQIEGEGFVVRRPFPSPQLRGADPFLLLDHFGPVDYAPGEATGTGDHPHRGFQTVTYLIDGEMEHHDSLGYSGVLRAGDVQWMVAGDGVVHRERPTARMLREGGRVHGFQLWVNLPRAQKRTAPRYQDVPAAHIPVETRPGATIRRISDAVETMVPVVYAHVTLAGETTLAVPDDHLAYAYVFAGEVLVGGAPVREGQLAVLEGTGDVALAGAGELMFLAGRPLREPVAWHGPFVMNEEREIVEAIADYRAGRMGRIAPRVG
ncbi:MAG: pirin family protein [Myxococcota bacterium]